MRPQDNNDIAAGAGYDRLMQRLKSTSQGAPVCAEPVSFASETSREEQGDPRAEFGKRRVAPLRS